MVKQMINNMENNLNEIDKCNWASQKNCNCGNYSNLSFIEYANDAIYQINNDIYGQQGQCKIKASSLPNQMYFILQGLPNVSQTSGVTSSLYCQEVKSQSQLMKYGNFMKYFEEKFKCSATDIDIQKKAIIKDREPSFSHYKKLNYYEESYYDY
ncbi:hypothetical protein PPERSA_11242 [Pseudocohnilembus persalinus]|uniref:Uncharacterized protein n=1 Tax=Pseudocohnilembus persalinus TaxID=266149 RepID=A0A0V0R033_PSEPJ|nr:hypothetical protein PPERSA_11242 [Pseudocohnilembus persalinus]|eukprot:KRX07693.1 hypothetical protein PPERSA_11242 [Pseudocohnilembus persalinus]